MWPGSKTEPGVVAVKRPHRAPRYWECSGTGTGLTPDGRQAGSGRAGSRPAPDRSARAPRPADAVRERHAAGGGDGVAADVGHGLDRRDDLRAVADAVVVRGGQAADDGPGELARAGRLGVGAVAGRRATDAVG